MLKTSSRLRFLSLFLLPLLGFLVAPVCGQQNEGEAEPERVDPGPFYGFWQFEEPAGDTCIVIIKRGGRLSCFWSGVASQEIQKGSWSRKGKVLTAHWNTGYKEIYRKRGDNAIERETYGPGEPISGTPDLTVRGVRIDSRVPGSLTVSGEGEEPAPRVSKEGGRPVEEPAEELPAVALPLRNAFLGFWKIRQSTGFFGIGGANQKHFYLQLDRNGEATVALRDWKAGNSVTGNWSIEDEKAIVTWPDGSHDILAINGENSASFDFYKSGRSLEKKPTSSRKAEKVNVSEAGRFFQAGNFKRLTVVDIRGTWRPVESTGNPEYIDIEGWGNAFRYPAASGTGTDPGKWRLKNDRVVITWVDGSKDVLRMGEPHMVQESYPAGEPITGTPERVIAVRETGEGRF
ncbi:MAG: hypothetical protein GVY10_10635 [Verrucomicrobia bacterium]|jgi:hypothetical protein|nr:hypothetical protein [Verrucomicrobiota bacterium]